MSSTRVLLLTLIIFVAFSTSTVKSQQLDSSTTRAPTINANREKAVRLLTSLSDQVSFLQSAENRARIGSNIVGSLWPYDENRARTLLVAVQNDINLAFQSIRSDDPEGGSAFLVFCKLRMDTVERVAPHDSLSALAFLKATLPHPDLPFTPQVADSARAIEMELANKIVSRHPDVAVEIGSELLARGLSSALLPLLSELSRSHRDQAQTFYRQFVSKLQTANPLSDWGSLELATSLAYYFTPPEADASTYGELVSWMHRIAANGCSRSASENNPACARLLATISNVEHKGSLRYNPYRRRDADLYEVVRTGSVDEILALTTKYPQMGSYLYMEAMRKAEAAGDFEQAKQIANDYQGDAQTKLSLLKRVESKQRWRNMTADKLAELQSKLNSSSMPGDRLQLLFGAVTQLLTSDREMTITLLNQAHDIIDTLRPSSEQTLFQFRLGVLYCQAKDKRGLELIEHLIPKLNELVAAAAKLDGYESRYLRDGEWNMTGNGGVGRVLTTLANLAGYFAWFDFDRSVQLTDQFERPEIRLMAQLKLAQGILSGKPAPLPADTGTEYWY